MTYRSLADQNRNECDVPPPDEQDEFFAWVAAQIANDHPIHNQGEQQ